MSREVVGLAPDDAVRDVGTGVALADPPSMAPSTVPSSMSPSTSPSPELASLSQYSAVGRSRRRHVPALVLVTVLVATAAFGWTGSATWTAARQRDTLMRGAAASATVLDMSGSPDSFGAASVVTRVRVVNVGTVEVTVTGAERGFLAARIDHVARVPATVQPGASVDLQLMVHVDCGSPQQLAVPPLTLRRPDGVLRPLQIEGAAAELVRSCNAGPAAVRTVLLKDIRTDGDRLKLVLIVPSGRTVRIAAIAAGEVALTGRPLPGTVDGQSRTIWLDPPATCPPSWRTEGVPRTLDLTVDGTIDNVGRAHVPIEAGYALPAWLLAGACGGGAR